MLPTTCSIWACLLFFTLLGAHNVLGRTELSNSPTGNLHRIWPNSLESFHQIMEIAEKKNLDIWLASPYASLSSETAEGVRGNPTQQKPPGGWLRVPHQITMDNSAFSEPHTGRIDIYVPSDQTSKLHQNDVADLFVKYEAEPIQSTIHPQAEEVVNVLNDTPLNSTFHDDYHILPSIYSFLHNLVETYPDVMKLVRIGLSAEGRDLWAVEISSTPSSLRPKKGVVISGPQHSREWIASSSTLYVIHSIVHPEGYLHYLLDNYNFYIVAIPNPDGYVWTWEGDRFWYKNRQKLGPNVQCVGIDTNRNWGYKWKKTAENGGPILEFDVDDDTDDLEDSEALKGKPTNPTDPCSHWYPGIRQWQAPEVNDFANYISTLPNLVAFFDLRSYGQMVSTPFSYTCKRYPKDAEDQMEAALGAAMAAKHSGGAAYATGNLCNQLYPAPGNVLDWIYKRKGVKFSYSIHLRDTGTYGFALPAEFIRPVSREVEEMLKSITGFILLQGTYAEQDDGESEPVSTLEDCPLSGVMDDIAEVEMNGEFWEEADDDEDNDTGDNDHDDLEEIDDQWVLIDGRWRWVRE